MALRAPNNGYDSHPTRTAPLNSIVAPIERNRIVLNNFVLIDYENVQPRNLELLSKHPFKVFVFVGANQSKIPFQLAESMQKLGNDGEYIRISGNGKNALDFHICFYLGQLQIRHPDSCFHIISKDAGFDPLISHMKSQGVRIQREKDLAEIPVLQMSRAKSNEDKIAAIVKNLAGRGQSRPRKVRTLANTINSLFTEQLPEVELMLLVKLLQQQKYIVVDDCNVSYKLPSQS